MNEKQVVTEYMRYVTELEEKKVLAKAEMKKCLKNMKGAKSQEFIDWYYWETDNDTTILAEILGVGHNQVVKWVTVPYQLSYQCQHCKQTIFYSCTSRNDAKSFLSNIKNKRTKEQYYCQQCKDNIQREQNKKLAKRAQTKELKARDKNILLHTMPYDEFLQTKYWKKFAKERLHEAGCKCSKCGRDDITLQVHHLTYERRGHELSSDVIVLCKACHLETHNMPVPKYMIKNPISLRDRAMQAIGK